MPTIKAKTRRTGRIQIGGDPEFEQLLYTQGRFAVTSPRRDLDHQNNGVGGIGLDGSHDQVELRPAPGKSSVVVRNLRTLFRECERRGIMLGVKGDRFPLGGHIHFSGVVWSERPLHLALDHFIGSYSIRHSGQARGHYGKLAKDASFGVIEAKPWGFEYRAPSASYLFNPQIAEIVYRLAYKLASRISSTRGITYEIDATGKATSDSLTMLIGRKSAEQFIAFHLGPAPGNCPINADWIRGKGRPRTRPVEATMPEAPTTVLPVPVSGTLQNISFRDEWDPLVCEALQAGLIGTPSGGGILSGRDSLYLFGLSAARGNVCYGIDVPSLERIADGRFPNRRGQIGLPYNVRMNMFGLEIAVFINAIRAQLLGEG